MFQPMYSTDALVLTRDKTITTDRGSITASTAVLLYSDNYIITFPVSLSAHSTLNIVINSSPSALWDYAAQSVYIRQDRLDPGIVPYINFENNWVHVGSIPGNSLTAVVTNIPTRWIRLEGQSFTSTTFHAFVWSAKMVRGY